MHADSIPLWQRVTHPKTWPPPPEVMTVSRLREIEGCPRRWALKNAEYVGIWPYSGYPDRPQVFGIIGRIAHLSLKIIVSALAHAECPSTNDPQTVKVLKELGGYSQIISTCIERVLSNQTKNPRAERIKQTMENSVRSRIPEIRESVQILLSRMQLYPSKSIKRKGGKKKIRAALSFGFYPEIELRANKIGWIGIADLLNISEDTCEIIDFKLGEPTDDHIFQVQVYALLWALDSNLNPSGRLAEILSLYYCGKQINFPAPSSDELNILEQDLCRRARNTSNLLNVTPPITRPHPDICHSCSVRHLCDEYWTPAVQQLIRKSGSAGSNFTDVELTISNRRGPLTWDGIVEMSKGMPSGTRVIIQIEPTAKPFKSGDRVRLLNANVTRLEEGVVEILLAINNSTECFWILN